MLILLPFQDEATRKSLFFGMEISVKSEKRRKKSARLGKFLLKSYLYLYLFLLLPFPSSDGGDPPRAAGDDHHLGLRRQPADLRDPAAAPERQRGHLRQQRADHPKSVQRAAGEPGRQEAGEFVSYFFVI